MYKIFFKNNLLLIKYAGQFCGNNEIYYEGKESLPQIIDALNNEDRDIIISADYPEQVFEHLKSFFKYIEAAGGLVKNNKNEYLFIKRWGLWDLPKGKAEKGESPQQTALREVEEECGISNLRIGEQLSSTYHTYKTSKKNVLKKTHWFSMTYEGNEKPIPQKEEKITDVIWLSREKTDVVKNKTYRSIKEFIEVNLKR